MAQQVPRRHRHTTATPASEAFAKAMVYEHQAKQVLLQTRQPLQVERVLLMRHGHRFAAGADPHLTRKGFLQAEEVAQRFRLTLLWPWRGTDDPRGIGVVLRLLTSPANE
eukprot:symbB.v1.2.026972.t1/scaffold2687.1/size73039/2